MGVGALENVRPVRTKGPHGLLTEGAFSLFTPARLMLSGGIVLLDITRRRY